MKIIIVLLFSLALADSGIYRKVVHRDDEYARCLDGSSPAMYLHQGDPKRILFYLEGGGVCGGSSLADTLENCYQRSKTSYGSSLYWPETRVGQGIQSTDPAKNIFANWTKVIMLYCDGAFHQGNTKEPFSYKDTKLYFRGSVNTRAHFQYIHNKYNLSNAERVILSGSSAGGIAALSWQSYLKALVENGELSIIADSAVLLKIDISELSNIYKVSNQDQSFPNKACAQKFGKQGEWQCFSFKGIFPYLTTQTLFIQSAYDYFIITRRLMISCLQQGTYGYSLKNCNEQDFRKIQDYRNQYLNFLGTVATLNHSIWSIDCSLHAFMQFDHFYFSSALKVPMTEGRTIQQAIFSWLFQRQKVLEIDIFGWPHNYPCSN